MKQKTLMILPRSIDYFLIFCTDSVSYSTTTQCFGLINLLLNKLNKSYRPSERDIFQTAYVILLLKAFHMINDKSYHCAATNHQHDGLSDHGVSNESLHPAATIRIHHKIQPYHLFSNP